MSISDQLQTARAQITQPGMPFELADIDIGGQTYRIFKNAPVNLAELIDHARGFGDKEFLVYQDERWSFKRFFDHVDALAAQLRTTYAIGKGERVAIAMRNRPEWMAAYAAIIASGAVAVPLNSWGLRDELVYGLGDSAPKLIFCDAPRLAQIAGDLAGLGVRAIVTEAPVEGLPQGVSLYDEVIAAAKSAAPMPALQIAPDDLAMIMYTSGTSSNAKGVVSTHRALCQGVVNMEFYGTVSAMTSPERIQAMMTAGFELTTLMAVPLFHSSGLHAQFLSALRSGRRIVIMYKWDVGQALDTIAAERITQLSASPAMMLQLFGDPRFEQADTRSLSWVGFGGAGIPDKLIELVAARKPLAMAGIGYGLTETNGPVAACTGTAFTHKPRSNGPQSPISEIRIVDDHGNELPPGQPGEICMRGVTNMSGYWRKEAATREVLHDGWFSSGDIGYLDDEGFLFVVDRIKDIVNRGGEKIASAEVESCLLQHPAIAEAAAFGVPDPAWGETLAVSVYLRPGASIDADGIRAHVAAHLAPFKVPAHIFIRPEAMPRNAVGKILKRDLRGEFLAQRNPV
jgi:long-chain acyl-CoA synthetase